MCSVGQTADPRRRPIRPVLERIIGNSMSPGPGNTERASTCGSDSNRSRREGRMTRSLVLKGGGWIQWYRGRSFQTLSSIDAHTLSEYRKKHYKRIIVIFSDGFESMRLELQRAIIRLRCHCFARPDLHNIVSEFQKSLSILFGCCRDAHWAMVAYQCIVQ